MTNKAWKDFKQENEIVEKLDVEIGEIINKNDNDLNKLNELMVDLEKKECLEGIECFEKVKEQIKEINTNCDDIANKRKEKIEHEEKLRDYLGQVEKFWDDVISGYGGGINLMGLIMFLNLGV